jgi:asparagine synthase (glutamine-hydrolysing)
MRLVSDVPLGVFLSGGLDSSIIVAMMAKAGGDVRTFSVTFDRPEFDESVYSAWVARRFRTKHCEVRLHCQDFERWLPDALAALDQPSFDGINTYFVSRAAKRAGLTVALSGLGADEIFGGYPFFRTVPWLRRLAKAGAGPPFSMVRRTADELFRERLMVAAPWKLFEAWVQSNHAVPEILPAYQAAQMLFPWWVREQLLEEPPINGDLRRGCGLPEEFLSFLRPELTGQSPANALTCLSLRLFMGERCLRDTDSMSMAVSLEVRTAFTDHVFLEHMLAVPAARRCRNAPNKPFQQELFGAYLGQDYPFRRKQGFELPFPSWLGDGPVFARIEGTLSNRRLLKQIGLNPDGVGRLLAAHQAGRPRMPWSRLWSLFVLADWCQTNRVSL